MDNKAGPGEDSEAMVVAVGTEGTGRWDPRPVGPG